MKPNSNQLRHISAALAATLILQAAHAQQAPAAPEPAAPGDKKDENVQVMEAFVTTGSNIKRLDQENTLPVTVFDMAQLQTRDSATPMDLLIGIPEITNIPANETSTNAVAARGDNANVALRGLGAGNSLVLLNGRRVPFHPLIPSSSAVNVNTLPTYGLQQIEVLRDGASSVYGSDAVAGVVNYITEKKPHGDQVSFRFGVTEHGGGTDEQLNLGHGQTFANGKGSWVFSMSAYNREAIYLADRAISRSSNRLAMARAPWNVAGSQYDGTTAVGQWAQVIPGTSTANTGTVAFYPLTPGATPTLNTGAAATLPRSLYDDYNKYTIGQPASTRYNVYNRVEYEVSPAIKVFGEGSFYLAHSRTGRQPITLSASDSRVFLGVDNPYNPYGSHFYSPTGAPNSDGTARLVGTPQQTTIAAVLLKDGGNEKTVDGDSDYRLLGGFGGQIGTSSWNWETAAQIGGVYASDESKNAVKDSYLRAAALRSDALAFNPFYYTFKVQGNAVVADQPYTNPVASRNLYTVSANWFGHSKLATWDAHIGGTAFEDWAGPISVSVGAEWRYEFKESHKDPTIGTNPVGSIGGDGLPLDPLNNDILVTSPKFDYSAGREIASAYAETIVPFASPKNNFPGAQSLTANASVRYEHYSDFGSTTKPKFGGDWKPLSWLLIRGSLNKGFRAPDLQDLYQPTSFSVASPPGVRDPVRNALLTDPRVGLPADVQLLTKTYALANPGLQPEISDGRSIGTVIDVPKVKGLSFSIDYWEITQKNLIISQGSTTNLDLNKLQAYTQTQLAAGKNIMDIDVGSRVTPDQPATGYQGDPFVLRNPANAADKALFAGIYAKLPQSEWVAPLGTLVGSVSQPINSTGRNFTNGLDFGIGYNLPKTSLGQFRVSTEWSEFLNKYTKSQPQFAKNDDINQMIVPKWKSSATIQWRKGGWDASVNWSYQSDFRTGANATQTQINAIGGVPDYIKAFYVTNSAGVQTLSFYEKGYGQQQYNTAISYRFGAEATKWLRRTTFRFGVNDLFDQKPALASVASTGYSGGSGSSLWVGRQFTFTMTRDF